MSKEFVSTMRSTKFELKDSLYYADLIYAIKKISTAKLKEDKTIDERIDLRIHPIHSEQQKQENEVHGEELSDFELDLFLIVRKISKMAGEAFKSLEDIRKYPELVQKVLMELENKKNDNELLNHLKSIVKIMGLEHAFSLGEDAEQCVCLNKNDNLWEVYMVERGISFEKTVFEECYDACLDVIFQLADSKQMYEEAKENFALVRKLVPNK